MAKVTKVYVYVDETGQDTRGRLFVVAVVVISSNRDRLRKELQKIEGRSGRVGRKWTKSTTAQRQKYVELLLGNKKLAGCCYYNMYEGSGAFDDLTILSTARAINEKVKADYKAIVVIDGLQKSKYPRYAAGLRGLNIKTRKVKGIRDEADEFIRLADAIAGFVRDYANGVRWVKPFFNEAVKKGFVKEAG